MGRWMIQLFSATQLEAMEQKDYDILKNTILKELETNSQILRVLGKKVRPIYKKMLTSKKKTRPVYKRRTFRRRR
jgi:hypothetical protein